MPVFGSSPSDGGIPYIVVDSGQTPSVSMIGSSPLSSNQTDSTLGPIPVTAPIEGGQADCSDSWPNIYQGDRMRLSPTAQHAGSTRPTRPAAAMASTMLAARFFGIWPTAKRGLTVGPRRMPPD